MPPEDLTSSSPTAPQDDSSLLTSPVPPPEQAPVFADRIALDQTLEQPSMADRIAVDEEENKRQRLENERKRMKEVDLLSKILPDTKSQTKEMAGIQTQANALIDPKLYTDMTVNWRATAALMGKPLDELDATQYGDYKAQIAVKLNKPAPKSESEYRSMLSEYFVKEKDKDTALNELYGNVVLKAFQDTGMGKNRAMVGLPTEYVKQWEEQHKDLIGGDAGFHAQANRVYNQTLKDIESIRGRGAETFSALMDFTQGKADDERIAQVAEHLSSSTPEERQKVYSYIGLAAEAGHIDRAGIEQFAINMGQSFSRGFDFIPQGTLQGQEDAFREMRDTLATGKVWLRKAEGTPTLNDVYRPSQGAVGSAINIDLTGREATPEEVATLKAQAEGGLKTFGVIRELRNAAKSSVDPIRPVFEDSAIERGAYGLAGSLGIMVPVAINPAIGMLAYQAQEYDRIMLENPEIDPTFAKGLSLVEGAGNAALDRLQLGAINGKLPVFGGLLNGIKNNGIRRVLTTVGVEILEQNLQEGAQDLIAPLTETLTAALREDMPDKDFGELMKDYVGSRAETFFAVLPLALIGGGIGTYRDLKNPAMQLADKQLAMAGFGPAQRDYINQASSLEEKATRIEQEWSKRTEQDITAGKEQLAASIAEARAKQGGDTVEVNTKADGSNEWIVRDPAGKEVARVASEDEAVTIIADRGEAEIKSQANVVADLLDSDWRKDKLPNFEAQFGGEVTVEQLLKDAEAKGDTKLVESIKASIEAHGNDPAELSKLRILGESWVTPYAEGQYKAFVKLNEGATAQDAFEEIAHGVFDIDIAEGRITKEQARAWVSQTAAAGVAGYKFGTDAEVRESMAQIAQDFARNKIDQTNLPSSFVAFLKKLYTEFVEFMRRAKLLDQAFAEGKIDAEFERYLMGKIGLSDASMIEREVSRIEGEQGGFSIKATDPDVVEKSDDTTEPGTPAPDAKIEDLPLEDGEKIPWTDTSFSIRARDEAYDAAVKAGDEAEQQRLVDEAAKEAGYTPVFRKGSVTKKGEGGFHFGSELQASSVESKEPTKRYYIYAKNPIRLVDYSDWTDDGLTSQGYSLEASTPIVYLNRHEGLGDRGAVDADGYPLLPDEQDALTDEEFLQLNTIATDSFIIRDPSQIKSADPITRDDAGNVIPLSQRFNPESNDIRFSIQSQAQIDRVNKAVADTTQFDEGRMALYERAKERFKAVLAENKDILDALKEGGAAPEKIRRAKLIQGIAELEVILRQLPAEVRGKVGGFGVLARGGTGDTFLANFFRDRVRMIDEQLEKYLSNEYDEELYRIFERAKPKKDKPGEKPKGIGADIQDLFAKVKEAQRWSAEEINAHLAAIDSRIDSEDLSPSDEARLIREADLIGLVGGWRNKDSNAKAHAIATLKETWAKGYYNFILKKTQEKEQREADRMEAIAATGKVGVLSERQEADKKENGWKGKFKKGYFNLIGWDQFVSVLFGEKSDIATRLANGERNANSQKEDATQAKMDEISKFFAGLAGKDKLKGEQLRWKMAQKSLKPFEGTRWSNLEFSEMEAVAATMLWMQEDGKRHMIGKLDDGGKPISAWNYTQEFVDLLEANLSKEAKALRDFLLKKYDTEYDSINKVYKALNGINLPKIANYSPVTVAPVNAPAGTAIDPVTGGVMAARGTSPGALRTRGQAIAEPKFQDALQTYIAHTKQMEHWKAYAPFMAEANGILRNRDVQNAIEAKGGKEAKAVLNTWTDLFSQGGVRSAEAQLGLSKDISEAGGRAARVALVGRIGTIIIQSTQLGAALAEMPTGAYILRMSKLLSGNLGWKAAFESDYIQRRLNEMPPIVRQAVEGLKSDRPNVVKSAVEKLGRLISGADAIFTAGTYAITYDYHLKQAKQMGIPSPEAYAKSVAERAVDKLAQPTRMGARSVIENTSTGLIRNFWAFASESRKNLGLAAYAINVQDPARIGRTLFSLVVLNSLLGNVIRNAWSDARDDDDDEWFDEKHWGLKRMLTSTAVDSLQVRGIPVLGDAISSGFYDAVNQYHQTGSLINFGGFIRAMKHIPKYVEGDADWEMTFKDIDGILSVGGLFNESIAAAASLSHLANDAFGVSKNAKKAVTGD